MRLPVLLSLLFFLHGPLRATVLHTGHGQRYTSVSGAAKAAAPGDTILVHNGVYPGDQSLQGLRGAPRKWICILAEKRGGVTFEGGISAWKGSDVAYLRIEGMVFARQTGNGLNFDDGGTYASPAHHIVLRHCIFRDMAATGNNDLLKLSGADDLLIEDCIFLNGSPGGSGIDMVGCHNSLLRGCRFENMGANAVQMKGGSSHINIEACKFKNAGSRALNLGGSTGEAFFRPADAAWEAADLKVSGNVFIGSEVPVAFVGCIRSEVVNNTIYKPTRWVIRILQENRDTARFVKCRDNVFRNNIVCFDEQLRTVCSIGAGTAPESFIFSNNLWFHTGNNAWQGPQLPVKETGGLTGKDPLFAGPGKEDFSIDARSPAARAGFPSPYPPKDHAGNDFRGQRAIGAFETK
ncbi:right-handed parallel beta-helix repeat-containing protein [Chitinophaga sp. GCM10012297]|uniref:Right-handed parallel beta-helix repeat-containing protein n=1 Tax=Chitinophaga chungangae TaxID=2821488 RepID=A0ABS3YG71_9BACT|nr:right-handed parallel beta-helix repeat-containing protein [Chitinophaga chungangae]MBO9153649.1 right-handed parallel beta-helix repeat-containing protein [Chitinophaga chungangae]